MLSVCVFVPRCRYSENFKSKWNFKHQILVSIPQNRKVKDTVSLMKLAWELHVKIYHISYQLSHHIKAGPCTRKHSDSDMMLMQNSMFIRKNFNKHFVFLQRNCTIVKVLQNAAESRGLKYSLQVFVERFTGHTTTWWSITALQAWLHLWTILLGIWVDILFLMVRWGTGSSHLGSKSAGC